MSKKLSNQVEEYLEDLTFYRQQFQKDYFKNGEINKDCPHSIIVRYFFSAWEFYKAMFDKTGHEVYRELCETMRLKSYMKKVRLP